MTTYLGKSCSICLPRVPFVNCRQFMYLVISLLVLRAGYGIWLYQFLIIAYLFTSYKSYICQRNTEFRVLGDTCLNVIVKYFIIWRQYWLFKTGSFINKVFIEQLRQIRFICYQFFPWINVYVSLTCVSFSIGSESFKKFPNRTRIRLSLFNFGPICLLFSYFN